MATVSALQGSPLEPKSLDYNMFCVTSGLYCLNFLSLEPNNSWGVCLVTVLFVRTHWGALAWLEDLLLTSLEPSPLWSQGREPEVHTRPKLESEAPLE